MVVGQSWSLLHFGVLKVFLGTYHVTVENDLQPTHCHYRNRFVGSMEELASDVSYLGVLSFPHFSCYCLQTDKLSINKCGI